nr:NEDD4-binding protein 1-like [Onthophagus taurus]
MAKNKRLMHRTVTTRAQARNLQQQVNSGNQTPNNRSIKKKQTKKHKRLLKTRLSMDNKRKNKAIPKVANSPLKTNKSDPLTIQIQKELEKLRKLNNDQHKDIFGDRHVSLSESPNGKSIQITCKNFGEENIKKESKIPIKFGDNWSEVSTIQVESQNTLNNSINYNDTIPFAFPKTSTSDVNINNSSTPKFTSRLSLSTQSKLFIQNLQGSNNLNDLKNERTEKNANDESDGDVICLDTVDELEEMNTTDDLICISDSKSESCIVIDDDNDSPENVNLIDLTSPNNTLSKVTNPQKNQQTQSTNSIASHNFPSTSTQSRMTERRAEFPVSLNSRFMEPPAVLVPVLPQHSQLNNSFHYNHQSNIYGNNFLNFGSIRTTGLRPIFIDGNNIAMLHSNGRFFSVIGLKICIDYFKMRGHDVTAIVPQIRKRKNQNSDPKLLFKLEKEGSVIFTPSRVINGKTIVPYDDRFIVQLAAVHEGVIISCDNYKDLLAENPNLRDAIENRVLNPTFVKNMIIFPSDPLGQYGPKLDDFLKFSTQ